MALNAHIASGENSDKFKYLMAFDLVSVIIQERRILYKHQHNNANIVKSSQVKRKRRTNIKNGNIKSEVSEKQVSSQVFSLKDPKSQSFAPDRDENGLPSPLQDF